MKNKKYSKRIIGFLMIAFVTANALLIYYDDEGQVERKSYIKEWSQSTTSDLQNSLHSEGVFAATETTPVYFNQDAGAFHEFVAKEGQTVEEGDDLYSYEVEDYASQETQLENKQTRLEQEITALENYIQEFESYTVPEPENELSEPGLNGPNTENNTNFGPDSPASSDTSNPDTEASYAETEFLKKEKIAEQETVLAQKEAMAAMVESQLSQLRENGQLITVSSPFSGTVTDTSNDLDEPILTLASTELNLQGDLKEEYRPDVEQEMPVAIYVPELNVELDGSLSTIQDHPKEVEVNESSRYPYEVTMDEVDEKILPGYHAEVEIITKQADGVVTTLEDGLIKEKKSYVWTMNEDGKIDRHEVETGLKENKLIEIQKGLEAGEWVAYQPKDEFRRESTFFTPLKLQDLKVSQVLESDQDSIVNYGLLGLLAR
ncbi:efflux RND transporter periplasmic adaptor subunit [Halobacillus sp. K22]|uniref:efflux RND transporter periplasmic adaptor subunit n=1 Tax=Halobacillus sp. K22 TaxID=3457431 RepID=UPI003FCEE373